MDQFAPVFAWLVAAAVAFGPGSIAITKLVDAVRGLDTHDSWPKGLWIVLSLVIGVVICVAFQINVVGGLLESIPAAAGSTLLNGTWGQVLSGLAIGGTASWHHEHMSATSARSGVTTPK